MRFECRGCTPRNSLVKYRNTVAELARRNTTWSATGVEISANAIDAFPRRAKHPARSIMERIDAAPRPRGIERNNELSASKRHPKETQPRYFQGVKPTESLRSSQCNARRFRKCDGMRLMLLSVSTPVHVGFGACLFRGGSWSARCCPPNAEHRRWA